MTHNLTLFGHRFARMLPGAALVVGVAAACVTVTAGPRVLTDRIIVQPKPGREAAFARARGKGALKKRIKHENGVLEVIEFRQGISLDAALA